MPTISRSFDHPLVTPSTALKTSARVRPCTAACDSFSRLATMCPSLVSSLMPAGMTCSTFPLGPSTTIVLPLTVYLTPCGNGIGCFPIRDISKSFMACESRTKLLSFVPLQPRRVFHPPNHSLHSRQRRDHNIHLGRNGAQSAHPPG